MAITFPIEVVKVGEPTNETGKGGGKYQKIEVIYKRLDRDGKVEGKPIMDFANKEVFKSLKFLKVGDVKQVTAEKDQSGYWQWTALSAVVPEQVEKTETGTGEAASQQTDKPASRPSYPAKAGVGKVTGSNYETKDERAARQILIVRQSSLATAVELVNGQKLKASPADVIAIAQTFEAYIFFKDAFADMEDDIPQ